MSQSKNPDAQLARELAREAGFLSERWRLWLVGQLAEEATAFDPEKQQRMKLHQRMSQAVETLQRVAQHLELSEAEALTGLTMSQFDAAPESVRGDWKARQIADLIRGSWGVAKSVAFTDDYLPVQSEHERKRDKRLARKRRESAFVFAGVKTWLEGRSEDKRRVAYDHWAQEQNQQLPEDQKPFLRVKAIQRRWPFPWPEIVQAVEAGHLPGTEDEKLGVGEAGEQPDPQTEPINLDLQLDRERLRSSREAKGFDITQLSKLTGLDASTLRKIERDEIANPNFQTIAKLAAVLNLSLDELIVLDEEQGASS